MWSRYLEHLVETVSSTIAIVRNRLAAIAAVHWLSGHPGPAVRPLAKATTKHLARECVRPKKQMKGLTSKALRLRRASSGSIKARDGTGLCRNQAEQAGDGLGITRNTGSTCCDTIRQFVQN